MSTKMTTYKNVHKISTNVLNILLTLALVFAALLEGVGHVLEDIVLELKI
jgi:hypothetical protein